MSHSKIKDASLARISSNMLIYFLVDNEISFTANTMFK